MRRGQLGRGPVRRWRSMVETGTAVILAALMASAPAGPSWAAPSAPVAEVSAIQVSEADGSTALVIAASARPTFTTWKLEQPPRIVVDVSGARLADLDVPFEANTFAVGAVSATTTRDEGGARTRVVLALRRPSDYRVETKGTNVVVTVTPHARPSAPAVAGTTAAGAEKVAMAALRTQLEAARLEAEGARRAADDARRGADEARQRSEAAVQKLETEKRALTDARAEADLAGQRAKSERALADAALARALAAEKQAEARARAASSVEAADRLGAARADAERARAVAAAAAEAVERLRRERQGMEAGRVAQDGSAGGPARVQDDGRKGRPEGAQPVAATQGNGEVAGRPRSVTLRVPSRIQRIDFVDEPTRSTVIIDLDEPSLFAVDRTGTKATLRLYPADLPRDLERSLDATEYLGPVRVISSYRDPQERGAVRVDVDLAEDVPSRIRQDGARLYWDFQKPARATDIRFFPSRKVAAYRWVNDLLLAQGAPRPAPAAAPALNGSLRPNGPMKKRYTGRRIDLDFKSADIHNILRLLADVGQVNIITSDDVKGDVTVKMHDVPWDQALDVVLRGKQLGSVREGNLIRVAPLSVLEKELEQEIARQKQITDVLPTETRLIGVSYADAKSLQDRAKDLLSARGKISYDERTNTLIVSDVARNLGLVEELVRNLDTQTSQVVIEARIVEARSTFVRQIGVQWGGDGFADVAHGNPTGLAFPYNIGIGGGATDGQTPTAGLVPGARSGAGGAASPNFAVNLPVAAGTGSGGALGLTLGSIAGAFNLNLRLSAMESTGQVRIVSSPRVMTLDNSEASIEQGVAIPISVVSAQGVQTVFVDAQLKLNVRPHVTNEGTVLLDLDVTRNEPDFVNTGARGDPTILKKQTKTKMLVRDGDTAVIGGIYQRNSGLSYAKVPFFADLPILGALFRNRRENDDRTEFLVFITPRIANRARSIGQ